jgi:hypothetical protein
MQCGGGRLLWPPPPYRKELDEPRTDQPAVLCASAGAGLLGSRPRRRALAGALRNRQKRRGVAAAAHRGPICGAAQGRDGAARLQPAQSEKRRGTYHCAGCAQPLFGSQTKFESGTGWPKLLRSDRWAVGTSRTAAKRKRALRSIAAGAAAIWAMSSTTGRADRPEILHERRRAAVQGG